MSIYEVNPESWTTTGRVFFMYKLTKEERLEIYNKRKEGVSVKQLSLDYSINPDTIKYWVRLIDTHGKDVFDQQQNRHYTPDFKEEIIYKVIVEHQSIKATAVEYGLPSHSLLSDWIKKYKGTEHVIVEKPRGRSPTMPKKDEVTKPYDEMTSEEKIKYLEEKNLYLEAENEFLKKLETVVQKRKKREQKK